MMKKIIKRYFVSDDDILEIINAYTFELARIKAGVAKDGILARDTMIEFIATILEKRKSQNSQEESSFEDCEKIYMEVEYSCPSFLDCSWVKIEDAHGEVRAILVSDDSLHHINQ